MWGTLVLSLGREDPLEKTMAPHSSTLAWKIPWTEEPGRLQSMQLQRARHDWATSLHFTSILSFFFFFFFPPSHLPPHSTPLGWSRAPVWVSWAIQQIAIGYLFYRWWCKFPCYSLHTSHPLLPSPHVHKSTLSVCFSTVAL